MSIQQRIEDEEGFKAKVATVFCEQTGLKMAEIIVRPSKKESIVQARWFDQKSLASQPQKIIGDLSCSPIETETQKTAIINVEYAKEQDLPKLTLVIKKLK